MGRTRLAQPRQVLPPTSIQTSGHALERPFGFAQLRGFVRDENAGGLSYRLSMQLTIPVVMQQEFIKVMVFCTLDRAR